MQAPIVILNLREEMLFEAALLKYSGLDQMEKALSPASRRIHLALARWENAKKEKELENLQFPVTFKPSCLH